MNLQKIFILLSISGTKTKTTYLHSNYLKTKGKHFYSWVNLIQGRIKLTKLSKCHNKLTKIKKYYCKSNSNPFAHIKVPHQIVLHYLH